MFRLLYQFICRRIARRTVFDDESCDVTFSRPKVIVVNSSGKATRKFNSKVIVSIYGERIKDSHNSHYE